MIIRILARLRKEQKSSKKPCKESIRNENTITEIRNRHDALNTRLEEVGEQINDIEGKIMENNKPEQ